ncbi:nuclear transport factor 2 family protein [Streptomyces sp. NPDC052040]|uniref:nuclear transport factor 2 family protein n=1 Tax=Streptomyces sp. NPDC052040 TaxID=3365682 RepID=UPI0037D7BAB6
MTMPESVVDRLAIAETVHRLASSQDAGDWAGLRALLADRVQLDLSRHLGIAARELSAEEFTEQARTVGSGFTATRHTPSNLVIDLDGEGPGEEPGEGARGRERAYCHAHIVAFHHLADGSGAHHCVMRGTWELTLCKTGGRWLIERFTVVRTAPLEGDPHLYARAAAAGHAPPHRD